MEGDLGGNLGGGDFAGGSGDLSSSRTFSRSARESDCLFSNSSSDSNLSMELKLLTVKSADAKIFKNSIF